MDSMRNGLIFRVRRSARRMADQHRHLRDLVPEFERAVERADADALGDMVSRYIEGIVAHFNLEDDVFFPALHGLRPERGDALEALSREHEGFLQRLAELRNGLASEPVERFADGFRQILADLGDHEKREEQLVRELSREEAWSFEEGP
jgi:hemerythrin superfamily protein